MSSFPQYNSPSQSGDHREGHSLAGREIAHYQQPANILTAAVIPAHISPRLARRFSAGEHARIESLMAIPDCREYNLTPNDKIWQQSLGKFEELIPFRQGESYQRFVFDRSAIINTNSLTLRVSHLVHYSTELESARSLVPVNRRIEDFGTEVALTRIESVFSGAGGAKQWQFSETRSAPVISQMAFLNALKLLARFDGVEIEGARGDAPLLLRMALNYYDAHVRLTRHQEPLRPLEISVALENSYAAIELRCDGRSTQLGCGLTPYGEPVITRRAEPEIGVEE